jgi:hypothetical protein
VKVAGAVVVVVALLVACGEAEEGTGSLAGRAEATASIDSEQVAFGDEFTLTVEVRSDPTFEIDVPRVTEIAGFRFLDSGSTRSEERGVAIERRWLRLRAEQAGKQTLPAFDVRYRPAPAGVMPGAAPPAPGAAGNAPWKTTSTTPIELDIRSHLPAGDQPPQIRDIKPLQPIERPQPWLWIAVAVLVVLAVAAAIAYWLRRRRGPRAEAPAAPPVPAHVVALAALERLAAEEPVGDAAVRRYYFTLSEIVRAYIEGRFGLNATDLTTEEIVPLIGQLALPNERALELRAFLYDTDAVKFASHRPPRPEIAGILGWARRFVEETKPVEMEPAGADATSRESATQEAA